MMQWNGVSFQLNVYSNGFGSQYPGVLDYEHRLQYLTPDCSGTPYMNPVADASSSPPPAMPGFFVSYVAYSADKIWVPDPSVPVQNLVVKSWLVAYMNSSGKGLTYKCEPTSQTPQPLQPALPIDIYSQFVPPFKMSFECPSACGGAAMVPAVTRLPGSIGTEHLAGDSGP
jgi:hypothetical protein